MTDAPPASPPQTDALARIEARLDRLEASIGRITDLLDQAPHLIAASVDTLDDHLPPEHSASVDERLQRLTRLTLRLTEPGLLASLEQLVDLGTQAPASLAMLVDVADDLVNRAREQGIDPVSLSEALAHSGLKLATLIQSPELRALVDSPALSPQTLENARNALDALASTSPDTTRPAGLFDLMRALRNDDVRLALGFALQLASAFGAALQRPAPNAQLPR
ncbi:DUF1641 domain-containing protein [Lujinxingia vulgaris]|uniref:DUF1641 domain-containing protein n=1 Tax=Lujinxingia vulgaris TaxID=2600176 RepID=A0A5C6XA60_9DELT|nr:DUF1641 domain-containing protein [Lujinxingia vulgaris]TXD37276.1 DUF1641 domain-containing protein [Lujinxingia vulgaris]